MLNEPVAFERPLRDKRLTILVMAGLLISLPHLKDGASPKDDKPPLESPAWIETAEQGGLYLLPDRPAELDWTALYQSLNLKPPAEINNLKEPSSRYLSLFLKNGEPPAAIDLPDRAAPLLFLPIKLNSTPLEVLTIIPGVGRGLAANIVDYRDKVGPITSRSDLVKVRGIGPKKTEVIERYIVY